MRSNSSMNKSHIWRTLTLTTSKIYNLSGSSKENKEKKNDKEKGLEDKVWKKIIELNKENGNCERDSYNEKKRNRKERKVSLNIFAKSCRKILKDLINILNNLMKI